ncbi:MAG TPA: LytR C-terminal domain-containing protein [Gaiellales bacterium]|jgi:hypothetical protein
MSRLIAIILLLAAIGTVFFGIVWRSGSDSKPTTSATATHGGQAQVASATTTDHASTPVKNNAASPPATKPKKHKPAKPIPPNGQIPVMVLNSNGIHGVAHTLAAKVQGAGYPITYVGNADKRGQPTSVQYAKGYGPAARKLAKLVGNVQFVTPFDGIQPAQAGKAKLVIILGT